MTRLLRHLRAAFRRERLDADLRDELAQHRAWKTQAYVDDGLSRDEAERRAAVDVGNVTRLREDARAIWGFPSLDSILQDVRHGLRQIARAPMFSAITILSLAIGIGATSAVFSVADALLFRKLTVADPDRLVVFKWFSGPVFPFESLNGYGEQNRGGFASTSFSRSAYEAFRAQGERYVEITAVADLYQVNLAVDRQAETGTAYAVDGNYFTLLGVRPALGRVLVASDDRSGALPAAEISHAFWLRRFDGAPDAIGRTVSVNAAPFTIAGVLPETFRGTGQAGTDPDVYVPLAQRALVLPDDDPPANPNFWWVLMMGRLRPGVRVDDARGALDVLFKRTVAEARPQLAAADLPRLALLPGARGQVEERARMRETIVTMAAVTAVVLLVACVNVAGLLLARGRARLREISIRVAIGASRERVVRQLFTEAGLLSACGTLLGVLVTGWIALALLPAVGSSGTAPLVRIVRVNGRLLAFAAVIASASAVTFGLLPALRSTDVHVAAGLEESRRGVTTAKRRRRLSRGLVAIQIALSVLLLTIAGLLVRSVRNLEHVKLGFDPHHLLLFQVDPGRNGYDEARQRQLSAQVLDRVRSLPGVTAASLSSHRLISNASSYGVTMRLDEVAPERGSADAHAFGRTHGTYLLGVDEEFFSTMGIPMLRGRSFSPADVGSEPAVVVNRSLALRLFGTDEVIGRAIRPSLRREVPLHRIVGVCADARYASLRRPVEGTAYFFYRQQPPNKSATTFEVRTTGDPMSIADGVREIVRAIDPTLPVSRMGTQEEQIAASMEAERLFARLASLLGLTALALSAIGLYGLLAYSVVQRTPEIGVRMALGAAGGAVRWLVMRESLLLVGLGLAAGVPAALAGTKVLGSLLFGLAPRDPATIAWAAACMLVLAVAAGWLPARRAARVDPIVALRAE